jgi:hypothetical protein
MTDLAWENDPASYHRIEPRMLSAMLIVTPYPLLDAQWFEPYHQPSLPDGCIADRV